MADPRFAGLAGGEAVATIFEHEDIAASEANEHAGYGQTVAYVAGISVKHQDGDIGVAAIAWASDVEGRQFLAIAGGYEELFEIRDAEL